MFKFERKENDGEWCEVMLSPFKTKEEIRAYYNKYSKYYPGTKTAYRITNLETGGMKVMR